MSEKPSQQLRGLASSDHLDLVRAVAAAAVLYSHAYYLLFDDSSASFRGHAAAQLSRVFARFGHTAVIVFFVLSGFFVGGIVVRDVRANTWSWKRYTTSRFVRLYLVLLPGLVLTAFWDRLSNALIGGSVSNATTAHAIIMTAAVNQRHGLATLLGNLGFLQTVFVPPYGSNTALWSLCNEFWYYFAFPFLWLAMRGARRTVLVRVCYFAVGTAILVMVGKTIAAYFVIWLMGTAICLIPRFGQRLCWVAPVLGVLSALVLAATLGLIGLGRVRAESVDFLVAISFTGVMYAMLHRDSRSRGGVYALTARRFAGFSYSLYVVHLPVLIFCRALLTYRGGWSPDARHLVYAFGIMALIMIYAFAISLTTEAKTDAVRRWAMARLDRVSQRPIVPKVLVQAPG